MMRHHTIDMTINSDIDLTKASTRRITITHEEGGTFRVTSALQLYAVERRDFVRRHLVRQLGQYKAILGQCSSPSAYLWNS